MDPSLDWLKDTFNAKYGLTAGEPFLVFSEDWVYFPAHAQGREWVASVPRRPGVDDQPIAHIGG